ncbi:collagen alpha-2(I) chain-like [Zalophus californianus]|uniref:Collagen alpha-2(I) chain-like n=1 Tax=Zalophus californianus TaxID=9704 RepID=A0A6P9F335_ZALCA|nr:collagen alpha-2(I) chain-like [Zalophus californianus]
MRSSFCAQLGTRWVQLRKRTAGEELGLPGTQQASAGPSARGFPKQGLAPGPGRLGPERPRKVRNAADRAAPGAKVRPAGSKGRGFQRRTRAPGPAGPQTLGLPASRTQVPPPGQAAAIAPNSLSFPKLLTIIFSLIRGPLGAALAPRRQECKPKSFAGGLEMGSRLTSGPRWAGNGGLGPAGAGRGRRNSERGEFLSVWLPSLASPARAPPPPGPARRGFRSLSFPYRLFRTLRRRPDHGPNKLKTSTSVEHLHSLPQSLGSKFQSEAATCSLPSFSGWIAAFRDLLPAAPGPRAPQRVPSLPPPTPDPVVSGCWVSGPSGAAQTEGSRKRGPQTPSCRAQSHPENPGGEADQGLWGVPLTGVAKKSSRATGSAGALGFLVTMATQEFPSNARQQCGARRTIVLSPRVPRLARLYFLLSLWAFPSLPRGFNPAGTDKLPAFLKRRRKSRFSAISAGPQAQPETARHRGVCLSARLPAGPRLSRVNWKIAGSALDQCEGALWRGLPGGPDLSAISQDPVPEQLHRAPPEWAR